MNQIVGIAAALVVALAGWLVRRNVEKLWQIRNLLTWICRRNRRSDTG